MKMTDSVALKIRRPLEPDMLTLAKYHAEEAHRYSRGTEKDKDKERRHSMACILFSALTLEVYINSQGVTKLPEKFWDHLDRISVEAKWLLIPLVVTHHTFDLSEPLWKAFLKLIEWRNFIVHYKEKFKPPQKARTEQILRYDNAKKAIETANEIIKRFKKLAGPDEKIIFR